MLIDKMDSNKMMSAYGIRCQAISVNNNANQPLEMVYCEIYPGDASQPHRHWELEKFIIIRGRGVMVINDESREVSEGDIITLAPFSTHKLTNNTKDETLALVSVYSNRTVYNNPPKSLNVFSPPATPNGSLHLGHISGPYFAADVIKRYAKIRGSNVQHISATDDHQSYVAYQAMLEKMPTELLHQQYRDSIGKALQLSSIECDVFYSPLKDQDYQAFVQEFFIRLLRNDQLICKLMDVPYCGDCQQYLVDANVLGRCPGCQQGITGHCCELCGFVADAAGGVVDPHCRDCGLSASHQEIERYFFPIAKYRDQLKVYLHGVVKNTKLTHFIEKQLENTWQDIAVTIPSAWGITVPIKTEQPQTLHVWFEMAAAFYYYQKKSTSDAVYCFGFDNSFYYTLYNPALIMAFDPDFMSPVSFICNEYYMLRDKKFSTSRRHLIWAEEIMQEESVDCLRWYIAKTRSERSQNNFDLKDYHTFCEDVIEHKFNHWVKDLNRQVEYHQEDFNSVSFKKMLLRDFYMRLTNYINEADKNYSLSNFSLNSISTVLEQLLDDAIEFTRYECDLCLSLTALKAFAVIAAPVMPSYCEQLLACLGQTTPVWTSNIACVDHKPKMLIPLLVIKVKEIEYVY